MSTLSIAYRLPIPPLPRAVFESDHLFKQGRLSIDGQDLAAFDGPALRGGTTCDWNGRTISIRVDSGDVQLSVDGARALREDRLCAPTSRSAWIHAFIALLASAAGFVASWLYLGRAEPFALKMAIHMAGWHGLLTLTLFPASVWGQRPGIRAVQAVSLLFFFIHAGIALANVAEPFDGIAFFNAVSGAFFLCAVLYGQRAHRDMDPLGALCVDSA